MADASKSPTNEIERPTGSESDGAPAVITVIVAFRGEVEKHVLEEGRPLTIGRGDETQIQLNDELISRCHARLTWGTPPRIEDLRSSNGTKVNGARIQPGESAPAPIGAVVHVGPAVITLQKVSDSASFPASRPNQSTVRPPSQPPKLLVRGAEMEHVFETLDAVAPTAISVLLLGETGVGKEACAQYIHDHSPRRAGRLVKINCAALPEPLLEAELFGYERGAFTGATQTKIGLFEVANNGTILLDEVGELALVTQAKLLRVLESGEVTRLGGIRPTVIDTRVVSSTNRDLPRLTGEGGFRSDLFFRLGGLTVRIPPLRKRMDELDGLADHIIAHCCARMLRPTATLEADALAMLRSYSWPGNIRELKNVLERAVLLARDHVITRKDIQFPFDTEATRDAEADTGLRQGLQALERERIVQALEQAGGNQRVTAEALGIARRTLVNKLRLHKIPRKKRDLP